MNKAELFKSLSSDQKSEFEKDIHTAIFQVLESRENRFRKLNNIKVHLRLENKIFLHVSMTIDNKGQILDDFTITKFKTVDQFLDSLLDARKSRNN
jgi:negative regulator of sigma E activity